MSNQWSSPGSSPPGWYPDPSGAPNQRYFDGASWTQHTQNAPLVMAPLPTPVTGAPYWVAGGQPASNSLATAALVLGIVAVVIEWGGILTLAAAVLAIVFGGIGIARASKLANLGKGKAIAGLVLGCLGICAYFFWGLVTLGIFWII